jgi:excisionase family DNA binding protein
MGTQKVDRELTVQMVLRRINAFQADPISLTTLYRLITSGEIAATRRGKACIRIRESEVERYLQEGTESDACNF